MGGNKCYVSRNEHMLKQQVFPGTNNLSLLFWNIHEQNSKIIGDKFLDPEFLDICTNDIFLEEPNSIHLHLRLSVDLN